MKKIIRLGTAFMLLLGAARLHGQVLITASGSGTPTNSLYTGLYGLVFLAAQDTTVRSIGFYDAGGDGLATAHRIGFGSGSGGDSWPFAAGTVEAGTDAPLIGGFRWVDLETPVQLQGGTYYTLAAEAFLNGDMILDRDTTDFVLAPTLATGWAARMTPVAWPENEDEVFNGYSNPSIQGPGIYVAANFSTQSVAEMSGAAVPEPATYAVIAGALGLGGALVARRRAARLTRG